MYREKSIKQVLDTVCSSSHYGSLLRFWLSIQQNFLFLIRTAEMLKVLQLLCLKEFYKTGQLYSDKHWTLMMFNKSIWDIYAGECLNRKKPHPNWEQHNRSTLTSKIQLINCQANSLIFTHQSDNKEHFSAQKPILMGCGRTCVSRERGIALLGRWLVRILA